METRCLKSFQESRFQAYVIFFVAASFYLYEYILQVAPSVMAEPMMQAFGVTAQGFGIVSACYFYAYAPAQLPAGLLFDRYGPRRLMTIALLLCAAGAFFFALTDHLLTAGLGRFFIGLGSAFSFIGVIVLLSRWFPPHYFAILAGVVQAMASVGAVCGEVPLASLVSAIGWRSASFLLAFVGVLLAILMWYVVRDYPVPPKHLPPRLRLRDEWKRLVQLWQLENVWLVAAYAFTIWTPIAVFGALWGVPYLQQRYGISVLEASGLCSMIWIGIAVGSPALGWVSDVLSSRKVALVISAACGLAASYLVLYATNLPLSSMYVILFIFGFGAGGQTVSFAVLNDTIVPELMGTASGFNNLAVLIGGALFQPLVGILLDRDGGYQSLQHLTVYSVQSYQKALLVVPTCFLAALLLSAFFLKETHPKRYAGVVAA